MVGHTTKHMTRGSSCDMEIGLPSVEDVTLGLRPRVACSTSGRHVSMSHSLPSVICLMSSCYHYSDRCRSEQRLHGESKQRRQSWWSNRVSTTGAEYCGDRVCLSVCLSVRERISRSTRPIFTKFSQHVTYVCGSVLLWRRCDMLCTSGSVDDVMFVHDGQE